MAVSRLQKVSRIKVKSEVLGDLISFSGNYLITRAFRFTPRNINFKAFSDRSTAKSNKSRFLPLEIWRKKYFWHI